jgi:regulatory protein
VRKDCHERALGLLAVRMRSRRELAERLRRAGFPDEEVSDVLGRLEGVGLIDDERFAQELAHHAASVKRSGGRAIASALLAKGVDRDVVARTVAEESGDAEEEETRALDLARSRATRLVNVPPAVAFQRLSSHLVRRGYDSSVARHAARVALAVDGTED